MRQEFKPPRIEFVTLSLYAGLITGATVWGCLADVIGRKLSWQITLFIAVCESNPSNLIILNFVHEKGVFGVASGGAPNFVALCSMIACIGFGVGGKLVMPVLSMGPY